MILLKIILIKKKKKEEDDEERIVNKEMMKLKFISIKLFPK